MTSGITCDVPSVYVLFADRLQVTDYFNGSSRRGESMKQHRVQTLIVLPKNVLLLMTVTEPGPYVSETFNLKHRVCVAQVLLLRLQSVYANSTCVVLSTPCK